MLTIYNKYVLQRECESELKINSTVNNKKNIQNNLEYIVY